MTRVINDALLERLAGELLLAAVPSDRRRVVGIAGIPGSGKSTFAARLHERVDRREPGAAVLVPLDGFHLPNAELDARGLRPVKGSPSTFDVEAYVDLLRRSRDRAETLPFPVYSRELHEPVWPDDEPHRIGPATRIVLTEGNYLLLEVEPWDEVGEVLDEGWLLETPIDQARRWIVQRHVRGGRDLADAEAHYRRNDLPNAELVLSRMREPDRRFAWPPRPDTDATPQPR